MGVMANSIHKLRGEKARFAKDMMDRKSIAETAIKNNVKPQDVSQDMIQQFAVDYLSATIISTLEDTVQRVIRNELGNLLISIGNTINGSKHNITESKIEEQIQNQQQDIHNGEAKAHNIIEETHNIIEETQTHAEENNDSESHAIIDKPAKRGSSVLPKDRPYVSNRNIKWAKDIQGNIEILFDLFNHLEYNNINIEDQVVIKSICSTIVCNSKKLFGMSYSRILKLYRQTYKR